MLRTRSPVALAGPRDLHVLSTPPAFVLSQDQTLQEFEDLIALPNAVVSRRKSFDFHVRITLNVSGFEISPGY